MKKKYEINKERGIKKTTLLSSTIIIFIVATIIGTVLIKTEYSNFKNHISNFRNTLIDRERFSIQTSIENLKKDIEFEKLSILNSKKQRIKNQSIIAYNLATSLYENFQDLDKIQKIQLIKSSLSQIAQKDSDINYFILKTDGTLILNTDNPRNEGVNYLDFEDINGVKFTNKIINGAKNKQNFVEYYWFKPYKRITYSRHLEELDLIIGSASYLESSKEELKNKLLQKVTLQNYSKEEFLFIHRIDSLNDIRNNSSLLVEKNITTSAREINAIEELLIKTNYQGNDFLYYHYNKKLLYGIYLKNLRYFISMGIDLEHINKIVEKEKNISLENMYSKIIKLLVIIGIMMVVFFIFSLYFTRKIEDIFQEYKKSVLENEEKYHMLFNHSNDGFIISEIDNKNRTIITSFNDTAAIITKYEEELLNKEFFSLFFDLNIYDILKESAFSQTVKLKTKMSKIKTIELNAVIYTTNKQQYLFASLRDITERTLLKEEKEKQDKILIQKSKMASMGEMIGNIAHQWRQPLSQVSGLFFDIESAYDYNELNKKYLKNRVEEANDLLEYMSKTIDDFRHFFNPNAKKEVFTLKEAVENAIKIVKSTLDYYQIELIINIDEKIRISGYKNEYSQAIMNIITNAKDVLKEKEIKNPQIKIYARIDDKVNLCIEDNAGGIDKNIIDKIFDPYFTTKYEYGTGIGLYMTKLIIEDKMNGTITVKNSKDGAIFTIET